VEAKPQPQVRDEVKRQARETGDSSLILAVRFVHRISTCAVCRAVARVRGLACWIALGPGVPASPTPQATFRRPHPRA